MAFFDPRAVQSPSLSARMGVNRHGSSVPLVAFTIIGIENASSFPTFVMALNPSSLEIEDTHNIQRGKTRGAYVEEHWGKELASISASGSSLGFFTFESSVVSGGVTVDFSGRGRKERVLAIGDARRDTIAYAQILDLVDIFRNNGAEYGRDGSPVSWGGINMIFDNGSYDGWFTSLELPETADKPFQQQYSFRFQVKKTLYLLAVDQSSGGAS